MVNFAGSDLVEWIPKSKHALYPLVPPGSYKAIVKEFITAQKKAKNITAGIYIK